MRINPENFIFDKYKFVNNENFFLINGNEETYINKITSIVIRELKKNGFEEIYHYDDPITSEEIISNQGGNLFSDKKILVCKNSKNINMDLIKEGVLKNVAVVFTDKNNKSSSKIKKFFDNDKRYASISCYKLTRVNKKNIADFFFNKHNIKIDNDGYWFFLDATDNKYMLFENEILKIINFDKKNISLKDLTSLLSLNETKNIDDIFFLLLSNSKDIINSTRKSIVNSSDSYVLLQRIKFYLDICLSSKSIKDAEQNFPKYLFMDKQKFLSIYKKMTFIKMLHMLTLVKKTEIMLRKNTEMHFAISQRFVLNLKKTLK